MNNIQSNISISRSSNPQIEEILAYCEKIEGIVRPKVKWADISQSRKDRVLGIMAQLPPPAITNILSSLIACADFYVEADLNILNSNVSVLQKSYSLLDLACKRLGLKKIPKDIENKISEDDVVEILDENYLQIFRNLSFFALSNYSIHELISSPWYELYERSTKITENLMRIGAKLSAKEVITDSEMPAPYTIVEKQTEELAAFQIQETILYRMEHGILNSTFILSVKKVTELANNARTVTYI